MKKKILVLVGIAVCTILLTSPVLASAGYSKIYGNANEDDVLDMRDVTYIKLVIFGKKPATTLADANYDGKISMLDIGQTKLIILGKERKLTLVDQADRTVTVPRPIERVVSTSLGYTRVIVALDRCDKLKGSEIYNPSWGSGPRLYTCFGETKFACGGKITEVIEDVGWGGKNVEMIAILRPDVIFGKSSTADALQEQTGAPVVVSQPARPETMTLMEQWSRQIEFTGVVLGREEEAEELIPFMEEKLALVTDISSQIPDSEKPRVYFASRACSKSQGSPITKTTGYFDPIDLAGGINVAKEAAVGTGEFAVSKEQIIKWNPDIMALKFHPAPWQTTKEMVLSDPEFIAGNVNAIKNDNVYYCIGTCRGYPIQRYIPEIMYFAKMFHPEEFKDLDLEKEGNEIMEKFIGEEGLYTWLADDHDCIRDFIEKPPEETDW